MKLKLFVGLAVLSFASAIHADSISTPDGTLVIPSGAVVTSEGIAPNVTSMFGWTVYQVDYTFADGTGYSRGDEADGYGGGLTFDGSVSNVSFDWLGEPFQAQDNAGDEFFSFADPQSPEQAIFSGNGITFLSWDSADTTGGITSIDPTPDRVPEPSSVLLSAMGIAALIGLARKSPRDKSDSK